MVKTTQIKKIVTEATEGTTTTIITMVTREHNGITRHRHQETAGDSGRLKMKSPRGAASWGGSEPKFVVPRIKSHMSPSAVKMKMRSDDLTSPLWAELVFSSDEEFDKVKYEVKICDFLFGTVLGMLLKSGKILDFNLII